jgi:DMSO/TMAO reductase YedYZ molybdopterin-dependent catalytic subunit
MNEREMTRQFKEKTESTTWTRRSLVSWLGKGCVLALAGRGVSGHRAPTSASGSGQRSWYGQEGFQFQPGDFDIDNWYERTVDPQVLDDILAGWELSVGGMVENQFGLSFDQLVSLPSHNPVVDFHCVEGWSVYDVPWNGVHLSELFAQARVEPSAAYVNFHTLGGRYNESIPLDVALETNTILAYGVGGSSLSLKHGFPCRIVIPRLFGYKNAKFVERIELSDHAIVGYWVGLGHSYEGEVQPGRLRDGKY